MLEKINKLFDTLADAGIACPDLALVGLSLTENRIKFFSGKQYVANVMANMFKLYQINAKFIDQNQGENIETYLYYAIKFDRFLKLEFGTSTMLYAGCAQKQPLGQALKKLLLEFTAENLIGYASNLDDFKILFVDETNVLFRKIKHLMDDVYGISKMDLAQRKQIIGDIKEFDIDLTESEIHQILNAPDQVDSVNLMCKIDNKRTRLEANFYEEKARNLFLESNFLLKELQYQDK